MKRLTQQLAEVHEAQGKCFIDRQVTKVAIAAKEVAKSDVLVVTKELEKLRDY